MAKVVGLGEVLWDVFPDGAVLGGAPNNFTCHIDALGHEGIVASIIGRDFYGEKTKKELEKMGVETLLQEVEYPTGTVNVSLDKDGKATYNFTPDSAWDFLTYTEELDLLAKSCDAVCFGSLAQRSQTTRETIYQFLDSTKDSCIKVFDINIRQKFYSVEIISESLKRATVLKLNDEELPLLVDLLDINGDELEVIQSLKEQFKLDLIVLTKGADGSLLYKSDNQQSFVKPPVTKVVDTVGAGDSFTAAVISGILNGDDLSKINQEANLLAATVCGKKGAMP